MQILEVNRSQKAKGEGKVERTQMYKYPHRVESKNILCKIDGERKNFFAFFIILSQHIVHH